MTCPRSLIHVPHCNSLRTYSWWHWVMPGPVWAWPACSGMICATSAMLLRRWWSSQWYRFSKRRISIPFSRVRDVHLFHIIMHSRDCNKFLLLVWGIKVLLQRSLPMAVRKDLERSGEDACEWSWGLKYRPLFLFCPWYLRYDFHYMQIESMSLSVNVHAVTGRDFKHAGTVSKHLFGGWEEKGVGLPPLVSAWDHNECQQK